MKVVIFFALVAACCAAAIEKPVELINPELIATEKINGSQCIYRPELKTMTCRGSLGLIECPAASNFSLLDTQKFQVFGIAKIFLDDSEKLTTVEKSSALRRFWLYPRSLNSSTYLNRSIFVEDKWEDFELYYGENCTAYGIRITDLKCYERLVELFEQTKFEQVAKLGTGLDDLEVDSNATAIIANATTTSGDEIRVFGETLLVEQSAQKRGFGRGFGGFGRGFGGFGRGFGFGFGFGRGFGWGLGGWGMGMGWMNPWMNPWMMGPPILPPPMLGAPLLGAPFLGK